MKVRGTGAEFSVRSFDGEDATAIDEEGTADIEALWASQPSEVGGLTLVVLFPRPGTPAREQLDLIRVIGTEQFTTPS